MGMYKGRTVLYEDSHRQEHEGTVLKLVFMPETSYVSARFCFIVENNRDGKVKMVPIEEVKFKKPVNPEKNPTFPREAKKLCLDCGNFVNSSHTFCPDCHSYLFER